jgi:hypothetical protein
MPGRDMFSKGPSPGKQELEEEDIMTMLKKRREE